MAFAAGGVKYTLAHAFTPNTPNARHSVPTSRKAAITSPAAPPGKFLILVPGSGLENFQMKKPSRNCEARNEMPASHMVSLYCSSIRCPCTEISCGIGHMCITIGIADAIAITTIVTANIFAMSARLKPESAQLFAVIQEIVIRTDSIDDRYRSRNPGSRTALPCVPRALCG